MNYSNEVIRAWIKKCDEMNIPLNLAISKCKNLQLVEDIKDYLNLYDYQLS